MNVSRIFCPGEEATLRSDEVVPPLITGERVCVELLEKLRSDVLGNNCLHFIARWPNIS